MLLLLLHLKYLKLLKFFMALCATLNETENCAETSMIFFYILKWKRVLKRNFKMQILKTTAL